MKHVLALLIMFCSTGLYAQPSYEKYLENRSGTYDETIALYTTLAGQYPSYAKFTVAGETDAGRPLHLFIISGSGIFDAGIANDQHKLVLLINNGIHAGEPCGIDASLLYARDLLQKKPDTNLIVLIVPVFNVGGALNRGCCSRANQNGPENYGFRGNARLLDLNRDFMKAASRNTQSLIKIFRTWDPHLFVDTHTTDGADYPYNLTLIHTQHDKLGPLQGDYLRNQMLPELYSAMRTLDDPMVPYVNVFGRTPDQGFAAFMETPRYATGYAALFQCIGFVTEAHMLKPYPVRVKSTLNFLNVITEFAGRNYEVLSELRKHARMQIRRQEYFALSWKQDTTRHTPLLLNLYKNRMQQSKTGNYRTLSYDQQEKREITIPWYDSYLPADSAKPPAAYIVPQAWKEVVELLRLNGVRATPLPEDTVLNATMSYIRDFKTVEMPYEGRYLHYATRTMDTIMPVQFYKGDLVIPSDQDARRFIVEALEPGAVDSWFNWNFFDEILQQKEWFSAYLFDTTATRLLQTNPGLKEELDTALAEDPGLNDDQQRLLQFIYRRSYLMEPTFRRYPVGRLMVYP